MKTITQSLTVSALMLVSVFTNAQTTFERMYQKYAAKPGFTSVSVSNDMFHLFSSFGEAKDSNSAEMRKVMNQLTGLKALVCDVDSTTPALALAFYNEATAAFPPPTYQELITVEDSGENIRFLTRQDASGKIHELVMLIKSTRQNIAMTITGNINLSTISKLSKAMDIKGLENLEQLKGKKKK